MDDHMYMVLPPDINNIEDLELWKSKFDSMTYYQRKISNDISIEQFGEDNIARYNILKSHLLDRLDPNISFSNTSPKDTISSLADIINHLGESASEIETREDLTIDNQLLKIKKAESEGLIIMIDTDYGFSNTDYPEESISKLKESFITNGIVIVS